MKSFYRPLIVMGLMLVWPEVFLATVSNAIAEDSLIVFTPSVDVETGYVWINGVDTRGPTEEMIGSFTWEWGDGTTHQGWFPQTHTYSNTNMNYVVRVTSHYTDGTADYEETFVEFGEYEGVGYPDPYLEISVPDTYLRQRVLAALGLEGAGTITRGDMQCLTSLDASSSNVSDLTGLDYAAYLSDVDLADNQIHDISPLTGLTNLSILTLLGCPLNPGVCSYQIPLIESNNPGVIILYDPCTGQLYTLTVSSSAGGHVAEPGEGAYQYDGWTLASIVASPEEGYSFVNWTGTAVTAGKVADPNSATTTVTVDDDYTLQAHFEAEELAQYTLSLTSTPGGRVSTPGEGTFSYAQGANVLLIADADPGYHFTNWSGNFWSTLNPLTLTMDHNYTVQAEFEPTIQLLTVSSSGSGSVLMPGEGQFEIPHGTVLTIEAAPADSASEFQTWTGTAVEQGKVQDPNAAQTTVLVDDEYELTAVFAPRAEGPALGFSLGELTLDDAQAFEYRVSTNNTAEASFVELVTGLAPDPNGMMRMQAVAGAAARAKARFGKCEGPRVLVWFTYLFEVAGADLELVVYLSDVPELLGHDDPQREVHYVEIGRVPAPPAGRPGSFGSGRLGTFEVWAWTQGLDLSNGTWVELELVQSGQPVHAASVGLGAGQIRAFSSSDDPSVVVGGEAVEIHCDGICMDLSGDDVADEEDFLRMIAACGRRAELLSSGEDSLRCLDGIFSRDGYVDSRDIDSWAWALGDGKRKNLCPELPLAGDSGAGTGGSLSSFSLPGLSGPPVILGAAASLPGELMVMGKCRMTSLYAFSQLRADCIGLFKADMTFVLDYTQTGLPTEYNVRMVRGPGQSLYLVNSAQGVLRIDGVVEQVIPPATTDYVGEPRYHEAARVYVGIQGEGPDAFGRPVLDVALDQQGRAYVVPVVVAPAGREAYVAAAELALQAGAEPPYQVVRIFDDPPPANDNGDPNQLREIEVDGLGNVYVANAHALNESDMVWKYGSDGVLLDRLSLMEPDGEVHVRDPLALQVSADGRTLYLASGQCDLANPDEVIVYKISTVDLSGAGTIRITQMRQVTSLSEDPATRDLWVAGFQMPDIPEVPSLMDEPFYVPCLARVPPETETVQAVSISDAAVHNLALPTSIVYIGTVQE